MKGLIFGVEANAALIQRRYGAHRIASFLREHGWDIEVIDFVARWSFDELKALAVSRVDKDMKWIGVGSLFTEYSLGNLEEFLIWIKATYPDIKIIYGSQVQLSKNYKFIDYNINGFGENAILALLKYLFSNGEAPKFSMKLNSGRNISANDMYPAFPMKSLMVKYEDRDFIQPYEWLTTEFSRGCKFSCAFCNFPVLGVKGDYSRDQEDFRLQLMDAHDRFGIRYYSVADETFNDSTEKITKFADVVEKLPFEPFFTGFIRPDLLVSRSADREELLRMKFLGHFYGIESFNHKAGKSIGKGMDPERLKNGLVDLKNYFKSNGNRHYRGYISLIAGLPYETIESLKETQQWLLDHWQDEVYSIFPLEIPRGEYDYPSKMSVEWAKYGYRDASNEPGMEDIKSKFSRTNLVRDLLTWRNDYMTIADAARISQEMEFIRDGRNPDVHYRATIPNFSLVDMGLPDSLDARMAVTFQYVLTVNSNRSAQIEKRVAEYIYKKLGL